jgi:hypothetical protein
VNWKAVTTTMLMGLAVASGPAFAATHLEQPNTGTHVTLVAKPSGPNVCGTLSFQNRAFFRVFPNATTSSTPFVVPQGRYLVVTDVEWAGYGGVLGTNPLSVGNTLILKIFLALGSSSAQVFRSRGITLDATTAAGRPGTSEQLTAGFVVGPNVTICPAANQEAPTFGATVYIDEIILRGYLSQ